MPIRNNREPFFNDVPRGVLALGGSLFVIEVLLQLLGLEWRSTAFLLLAFFPIEFSTPYKELFLGNRIRFPKRTTPLWHCQSENVYLSLFQHGLRPRQTTFQQLFVRCDLLAWNYSDELNTSTSSIFGYLGIWF